MTAAMKMLEVNGLTKRYEKFYLDHVSFSLEQGYIMGFIGSNGAGKTTTLKGIMNMIHTESGEVQVMGRNFRGNELELKQEIAFMLGGSDYYPKRKLKAITATVKRFYSNWDHSEYERLIKKFDLDEDKKIESLSQGMKVKYSLALALSHQAKLIILDEPTSGLDPVARDNLLELFQELVENGDKSILFSTHITSDLEKCADFITYIKDGRILESTTKDQLIDSYRLISGSHDELEQIKEELISFKENSFGFQGLIPTARLENYSNIQQAKPSLDDIMIYHSKKEEVYA